MRRVNVLKTIMSSRQEQLSYYLRECNLQEHFFVVESTSFDGQRYQLYQDSRGYSTKK